MELQLIGPALRGLEAGYGKLQVTTGEIVAIVTDIGIVIIEEELAGIFIRVGVNQNQGPASMRPFITQVAISFAPVSGGSTIDEFVSVTDGRFSTDLQFSSAQVGNYELLVYGGQAGQSLTFLGNFSPVTVLVAQPDLVLRQATLAWGEVAVGESRSLSLTLLNTGSQNGSVTDMSTGSGHFLVGPESFVVAPSDSATVSVTFAPTASGSVADTLRIVTNDPDRPTILVALSGSAVSVPQPSATSADFDGDGTVGFSDFLLFAAAFGAANPDFDLDGNGAVGFSDFLIFAAAFGRPAGG